MHERPRLNQLAMRNLVREALTEDVGSGDATTLAVIPEALQIKAELIARESCTVAGLPVAEAVFAELDGRVAVEVHVEDGGQCLPGNSIATVSGPARAILTGERTALNFLQRLSGIATVTARYVAALGGSHTRLLDTRKTTPCLRMLEKYAVVCGGGTNHRLGLYDRIMIKDNHRQLADLPGPGGIGRAVQLCRQKYPALQIEVEADTIDQVRAALEAKADYVLLDNMDDSDIADALRLRQEIYHQALLEASGGITIERLPALARLGVDFISVGAITHSARAIDIGLDLIDGERYPA